MILVCPPLYYIAFFIAVYMNENRAPKCLKVAIGLLISSLTITVLMAAILWNEMMAGLIFAVVLLMMSFPLASWGTGVCLGVASKRLWLGKRHGWALALGGASVLIPMTLLSLFLYDLHINRLERAAALQTYQSLTIKDQLGDRAVIIPISPQIELRYRCYGDNNLERGEHLKVHQKCRELKNVEEIRSLSIEARPEYAPELSDIKIYIVSQNCKSKLSTDCVQSEVMDAWCAGRKNLKQSIFCAGDRRHRVHFKRYESSAKATAPSTYGERLHIRNAPDSGLKAVGEDVFGTPVLIRCSKVRDERFAKNGGSRLCYLKFFISKGVMANVTLDNFPPETLKQEAEEMFKYTNDIWQAFERE